ncbi:MAG: hypothetical protein AAB546_02275 [Patescibacteria group bacterium]
MENSLLLTLYARPETVFTVDEIFLLFPNISAGSLLDRLYYFAKVGKLNKLHRGVYAKIDYQPKELAAKLYRPAYLSLETVLLSAGVIFQFYEKTLFVISHLTKEVTIDGTTIHYHRIKKEILANAKGVEFRDGYWIATPERAFLDAIYIYKDYHFDNLGILDWEKIKELKTVYENKAFEVRVRQYYKIYKNAY